MTDETNIPQLERVAAVLDGLSDATLLELYRTLLPFDNDMIAAAVARRALEGGGGGSQPPTPFVQADDPGAVGAGAIWVDTTAFPVLKIRDGDDEGWITVPVSQADIVALLDGSTLGTLVSLFTGDLNASGSAIFTGLPTEDPGQLGRIWNDSGAVAISPGVAAIAIADITPDTPVAVVMGVNDEFVFTGAASGGNPEVFTVSAGVYASLAECVSAMAAAEGNGAHPFSDYCTPSESQPPYGANLIFLTAVAPGPQADGDTLTFGDHDVMADFGFTLSPNTFVNGL